MKFHFGNGRDSRRAGGFWPKKKLVAALRRRYQKVDDLGDESGFSLYGVNDGEIRFAVAMALAAGSPDKVSEVGFLARFSGFNLNASEIESINRNLHISVAAFDTDGDLYLIGGVSAAGAFNEGAFSLILEAWKRDLLVIVHAMSLGTSFAQAFPAARLESVRRFALNRAPAGKGAAELFARFADRRSEAFCSACGGRGKIGFIARNCEECDGSGFVADRNSR